MKSKITIFFILISFSYAGIITDFKNKNYQKICNVISINNTDNEKLLSLVGISCVKTDNLYLLPLIIRKLKHTKASRLNAIYFLIIYMQKKLLYSFVFDGLDLKNFDLPDTNYIISHVFYKIKHNEYKKNKNIYIIQYMDETIKMYKQNDKLFIDEYKQNKLIKRHWYR